MKKKTKTDYNAKISENEQKIVNHDHNKYITTAELSMLTTQNFAARLSQANLVTKKNFDTKLKRLKKIIN